MAQNNKTLTSLTLKRTLPYVLMGGGFVGLMASFVLTYDKIQVLTNPGYDPACNINPILSCGSVMATEQASILGMPNTIFGVAGFAALITFGLVLAAGARFKRWLWLLAQVVATIGILFIHYLFFQSVFRINAICIWCFATWLAVIPIFWYITLYNLEQKFIQLPTRLQSVGSFLRRNHGNVLIIWYALFIVILLKQFWYYWSTLI